MTQVVSSTSSTGTGIYTYVQVRGRVSTNSLGRFFDHNPCRQATESPGTKTVKLSVKRPTHTESQIYAPYLTSLRGPPQTVSKLAPEAPGTLHPDSPWASWGQGPGTYFFFKIKQGKDLSSGRCVYVRIGHIRSGIEKNRCQWAIALIANRPFKQQLHKLSSCNQRLQCWSAQLHRWHPM